MQARSLTSRFIYTYIVDIYLINFTKIKIDKIKIISANEINWMLSVVLFNSKRPIAQKDLI